MPSERGGEKNNPPTRVGAYGLERRVGVSASATASTLRQVVDVFSPDSSRVVLGVLKGFLPVLGLICSSWMLPVGSWSPTVAYTCTG
jgi:hypothetical protein